MVRVDGSTGLTDTARAAAGAVTVRRDLAVPAGTHSINVSMIRIPPADSPAAGSRPDALPDTLEFAGLVTLAPREIAVVRYEPTPRRLMVHGAGGR